MGRLRGKDVVRMHGKALGRCQGKVGRELLECIVDEMQKVYGKTSDEIPDDLKIWRELFYLYRQLEIQKNIHEQIYKSIDRLEGLEYPQEKIENILKEFDKPIGERNLDVVTDDL